MRLRIYRDGVPDWSDNVPARARVVGYGGSAMGHAITPMKVPQRSAVLLREKDRRRKERRERDICGAAMGWRNQYGGASIPNLVCHRAPGHKHSHRSKEVMERDSDRRRSWRPLGGFRDDVA